MVLNLKTGISAIFPTLLCTLAWATTPVLQKVAAIPGVNPLAMSVGGRTLETQPEASGLGMAQFESQWPGTYFEAAFEGTEVYFQIGTARAIFDVIVDQQAPLVLNKPEAGVYRLSRLANGSHSVSVLVVTESQSGPNYFGGFAIPSGEKALRPHKRSRQIEFIGDSHTVGYGNTSPTRECTQDDVWNTTNSSQSFGPLIADHYHADYQINAISGRGIVRNYNGMPADTLPVAYPYVLFGKKQESSDPSWRPQIIVISLGTNDFSTPLNAGEKWKTRDELRGDYEATYVRFIQSLRAKNPNAYIILWATEMANGEIESEVKKVLDQLKTQGETKVTFIPVDHLSFSGCHYHPSVADDKVIRDTLVRFIDSKPQIWQGK